MLMTSIHNQIKKMSKGIPLSEEDRVPWLEKLRDTLRDSINSGKTTILACSALQKKYREILRMADESYEVGSYACCVKFVLLDAPAGVLAVRINARAKEGKHFMLASLLQSQLDLLDIDPSEGIIKVDGTQSPHDIVNTIQNLVSNQIL